MPNSGCSGAPDAAAELFRRTLARRRETLGPRHTQTMNTQFELALALSNSGKRDAAAHELREVVAARAERVGSADSWTLDARMWLGTELASADQLTEAITELRSTFEGRSAALGPEHPDRVVRAEHSLLGVQRAQEERDCLVMVLRPHHR